jgi:hypothetical protein
MEDVVAIRVREANRRSTYFVTWGRVLKPLELESVLKRHASSFGLKNVTSVTVCDNLGEAASARYFYEALIHFASNPIPFGKPYGAWKRKTAKQLILGKEIYFCGKPKSGA